MKRIAAAVVCLVILAGCGRGRSAVAPASTAAPATTAAPTTTTVAPTTTMTPTTTEAPTTTAAPAPPARPKPVRPPADDATEPLTAIGEISIARLGVRAPLYEGVTLATLDHGPGHWPGSALPGEVGNAVVAGHRVSHSKPFRYIDRLEDGDTVVFTVDGRQSVYLVTGREIVTPDRIDIVDPTPDATATLFACEPPGSTRYRYVVHLVLSTSA
jgi:sortase A